MRCSGQVNMAPHFFVINLSSVAVFGGAPGALLPLALGSAVRAS